MEDKDRKIRKLERQLAEARREADSLRRENSRFRYGADQPQPASESYRYDQRTPPPKIKPGRIALIIGGSLAALVLLAALLVLLIFTALNSVDSDTTAQAEALLQAVVDQDADRAFALTYPGILSREEFDVGFAELCEVWRDGNGGDTFELKRTSWSMDSSGGITQYTSVYRVSSGQARFVLELDRKTSGETAGITRAYLTW